MELKRVCKNYSYTKFVVIFEDESHGQEPQTIEVQHEPTDDFLKTFMKTQYFTKVIVKEVKTEVRTLGFDL